MKGGSRGDGNVRKQKGSLAMGAEIVTVKRRPKTQMHIHDIFGDDCEDEPVCTVCSMCGDVGFQDQLLFCSRCHERQEHNYCSPSYQALGSTEAWVCDWCWPSLKRASDRFESDAQESIQCDGNDAQEQYTRKESRRQSTGTLDTTPRMQNGLDLLLEVASWATANLTGLPQSLATTSEEIFSHFTNGSKSTEKEVPQVTTSSTSKAKVESNLLKPSSGSKRKPCLGSDRWNIAQKRVCPMNTYEATCAQTGIQLERSTLAKGQYGQRYRLLSSMLC